MKQDAFSISELSEEFNISSRTLRYYEEQGILSPKREGTRRIYTRKDHGRVRIALRGKRLGFSLSEIKEILDIYIPESSDTSQKEQCKVFLETINKHLSSLEKQREDLEAVYSELLHFKDQCKLTLEE